MSAPLTPNALREHAVAILKGNDLGTYTVPTKGLYPFQWNWDSSLVALGQGWFDEARAWTEIETLLAHQWPDGMVPHIIFHVAAESYFPGPDVWSTGRPVPTSGITQPPVAGFALRRLYERAADRAAAATRARALLPKVAAWHRWFHRVRDPAGSGLVAILHPWESGRDNSCDWDAALMAVPDDGIAPYVRRDTAHVDAAQRPTKAEYDRYLWLVQRFRALGWDQAKLHEASPFRVVDPGFNAILIRAEADIAWLAGELGLADLAAEAAGQAERGRAALAGLWSERHGQFLAFDRATGQPVDSPSIGGLMPVFALTAGDRHAAALARRIAALMDRVRFGVPSHDPQDARFDRLRYWRGPVWLITNYMVIDGLARTGAAELAARIAANSLDLVTSSGFHEYYDPLDGRGLGGETFSWTAAMVLEYLAMAGR